MPAYVRTIAFVACGLAICSAAAQNSDANKVHEYKGKVIATREAEVAPRIDALLDKIHFTAGQIVKEGQLLFDFVPRSKQASLTMARAKQK